MAVAAYAGGAVVSPLDTVALTGNSIGRARIDELLASEARAREAWLSGQLQQLTAEERGVLREAAVIMDKLASG